MMDYNRAFRRPRFQAQRYRYTSEEAESQIKELKAKIEVLEAKEPFYKHKIKDLNYIVQKLLDQNRKLRNKSIRGELNV